MSVLWLGFLLGAGVSLGVAVVWMPILWLLQWLVDRRYRKGL